MRGSEWENGEDGGSVGSVRSDQSMSRDMGEGRSQVGWVEARNE